jgi:arylsulfatase A-like enzyme
LLITIDTLRADRLGAYAYGAAVTPAADALAAEGIRFENAATCVPRTTQALACLLTGRYPRETGVLEIGERLPGREQTLAEVLAEAGYETAAFSASTVASRQQGLDQGFAEFVDANDLSRPDEGDKATHWSEIVTGRALAWLAEPRERPFFLWVHYFNPHFRYEPPAPYFDGAPPGDHHFYQELRSFDPKNPTIYFNLNGEAEAARSDLSRYYDGEVAFTDSLVARLLAGLGPAADHTMVVLTADHGESLGEHDYYYEHGDFLYEPSVRIPLIMRLPGVLPAGRVLDGPVSIVDIAPTTLGLLGFPASNATGLDLGETLKDPASTPSTPRIVYAESGSSLFPQNPTRDLGGRRADRGSRKRPFQYARSGRYVLVARSDGPPHLYDGENDPGHKLDLAASLPQITSRLSDQLASLPDLGDRWLMARDRRYKLVLSPELGATRLSLYDLDLDPGEEVDVSAVHPEQVTRLRDALDGWLGSFTSVPSAAPRTDAELDQVEENLRALGYIE